MTLLLLLVALAGAIVPLSASAENMEVAPVIVDLGADTPSTVVTVKNGGAGPMRYQVSAVGWTETPRGELKLVPTTELSAFPVLFQLGPGESRKIRVGATVPVGTTERAWRVLVEELPAAATGEPQATRVRIRTRFSIPVFQAPARPSTSGELSVARAGASLHAIVRNTGNVHFRPKSLKVALFDEQGGLLNEGELAPWYVLAAHERIHEFAIPAGLCEKVRRARAVAELDAGPLEATLALPSGACAP